MVAGSMHPTVIPAPNTAGRIWMRRFTLPPGDFYCLLIRGFQIQNRQEWTNRLNNNTP